MTAPSERVAVIGAGTSPLVAELAADGFDVVAVDVSAVAIASLSRLLPVRAGVSYDVADVRLWRPDVQVDTWHDRAVFHFLLDPVDRQQYVAAARDAVRAGGHVVIATFAPDGPEQCSGLPVARYDAESLAVAFAEGFDLTESFGAVHHTPWGAPQHFTHAILQRRGN